MNIENTDFPAGTKFLVTGGAGFIGSNIAEYLLKQGYLVRVMDNFSTGKLKNIEEFQSNNRFELLEGDIRDLETCKKACDGVGYVLHQAAWGSVPRSIRMPVLYEEINVKGHLNMMEAAREANVKKFIYASSSSVYGDHPALPKKEGAEGKVLSPYALTKRVNEEYADLYYRIYGLKTIGLRYFNVFGRRQDPDGVYAAVIPKFVKQLLNNQAPTINGDGETSRDFTYIDNVIEANLKACLAEDEAAGRVYNIAFGGRDTLNSLFQKLCQLLKKDIRPIYGPPREGDIRHSNADITGAKLLLGYDPKYSLNQGLELAVDWYKENL